MPAASHQRKVQQNGLFELEGLCQTSTAKRKNSARTVQKEVCQCSAHRLPGQIGRRQRLECDHRRKCVTMLVYYTISLF
jgi:hypothetical protein